MLEKLFRRLPAAAPVPATVTFAGGTDVGRKRKNNEDAFGAFALKSPSDGVGSGSWLSAPSGPGLLLAVSDGMGGAKAGEVASRLALEFTAEKLRCFASSSGGDELVAAQAAALHAHDEIFRRAEADPTRQGMGATLCALWFRPLGRDAILINVGDSRAYRWRAGELSQLSRDQTLAQGMIERGELTPRQAKLGRFGGILEHALGADGRPIEPQVARAELQPGDLLLLCSDGLHGAIDDARLARHLPKKPKPGALAPLTQELIEAARDASGADNITVLLALVHSLP